MTPSGLSVKLVIRINALAGHLAMYLGAYQEEEEDYGEERGHNQT